MYICNTVQMKAAEEIAAQRSSFLTLMENAGRALAEEIFAAADMERPKILILCGKGNNGGDGFAAARFLSELGANVTVVLLLNNAPTGIAGQEFTALSSADVRIIGAGELDYTEEWDVIADCVFGTGFHGSLPEIYIQVNSRLSYCNAVRVAADIPSGVNADTGETAAGTVIPDITVTFGTIKQGMTLSPGKNHCGRVIIRDIGIESRDFRAVGFVPELCDEHAVKAVRAPRLETSHKGSFGKVTVVGGSSFYSGAVGLTVKAALRTGAGIVRLASIPRVNDRIGAMIPECTFADLIPSDKGVISGASAEIIEKLMKDSTVVAYGGGLTVSDDLTALTREIIFFAKENDIPVVIDADGLNCLALTGTDILNGARAVLTPHIGELSRLAGVDIATAMADRQKIAAAISEKTGAVVCAKGTPTYIVSPDGRCYASYTGNAGLSTGGSGDALTGIISALIAGTKGDRLFECAAAGAYLFGSAADKCAEKRSMSSMLPSDVIELL